MTAAVLIFFLTINTLIIWPEVKNGHGPLWGFWSHRWINRCAVFCLPNEMAGFYKDHISFLEMNAVNADKRRYAVEGEAERHFIDLDAYPDSLRDELPHNWQGAVAKFSEDSLRKHGIAPWHVIRAATQLTNAFKKHDAAAIIRISTDLGHYVADLHVPLHTSKNYNGQLSGQHGIHGLWESRLPERFAEKYSLWVGAAEFLPGLSDSVWAIVGRTHLACDSVLAFEKTLTDLLGERKKFTYTERNGIFIRTYSNEFSDEYHRLLAGQVERQMRLAIRATANIWYSCWVNAGQPDLAALRTDTLVKELETIEADEQKSWLRRLLNVRPEEN